MTFLDWLKIIVIGIVEGVTEWLPISSTGHIVLVDHFWSSSETARLVILTQDFMDMFTVVIQFGAILAVVVLYFQKMWPFHRKQVRRRSWFAETSTNRAVGAVQRFCDHYCYMDKIVLWLKVALSCVPAILIGLPLDNWMEAHLYKDTVIASMLILYGVAYLLVERRNRERAPRIRELSQFGWKDALLIGVFQVLAMVPGTSRSGATILGGILLGASRSSAAEYTFFLAVPTMLGASLLKIFKFSVTASQQWVVLLLGMTVAFAVSVVAIRFLMNYIKKHDFSVFGWYRIALGAIVLLIAILA